jgi:hypothetical protein
MSIFIIVRQLPVPESDLGVAIKAAFPDDVYELGDGAWLVSDSSTALDVSNKIGITEGKVGSAVVIEAASYYGRANPAIWSWIKTKWEGGPNG